MRKRKKNQTQSQERQEPAVTGANPGEAPETELESLEAGTLEAEESSLEAQSIELPPEVLLLAAPAEELLEAAAADIEVAPPEPALEADAAFDALLEEPAAMEAPAAELPAEAESGLSPAVPDMEQLLADGLVEPMDELLAELLAQDTDVPAVEVEATASEELAMEVEALPDPEFLEETLAEPVAQAGESFVLRERESEAGGPAEAGVFELEAPEPEVLARAEPGAAGQAEVDEEEILRQMLAEEAEQEAARAKAAQQAAPEPEPLAPQPPLETVVSSIDSALEAAGSIRAPAEPAAPTHHHKQFSQLDDYVVFSLSGSDYAVPVRDVAEIGRVPSITRVPNVPDFVRGITNLRGEVVPVLNLPTLLGMQEIPLTARGRVLFLQGKERGSATGLLVDEVRGIQRIQSQQLEQVTGLVDDKVTSVLRGVHGRGDRLLNVLDLEQLFQLQEFRQLETR